MNVCIIGEGLTALSLAKSLINKKINVHNYHKNIMNNYSSSQTLIISRSNLEFFKKEIQNFPKKKAWKIKKIEIFSEKLKDNKILSIREMVDRDLCNTFTLDGFKIKNVTNINNTEDEIKEFAIEALNILNNNVESKDKNLNHQKKELFKSEIVRDSAIRNLEYENPIGSSFLKKTFLFLS